MANGTRTRDHRDHNPGLYQLSYRHRAAIIVAAPRTEDRLATVARPSRVPTPSLLALAAIGGLLLYLAVDVALVFLRPEFSVLHNAESDYGSKGAWAWLMDVNFLIRCFASIAVVLAIAHVNRERGRLRLGLSLLTVWAIASGLLAFFPDDPVGTVVQAAGRIHVAIAGVAFVGVAVGARITTRALRRDPRWRPVIVPLAVLSYGAFLPVLLLARSRFHPHSLGGLYEKLFLAAELSWFLVAAVWIVVSERSALPRLWGVE